MTKKVYERVLGTLSTTADERDVTYEVQLGLEVAQLSDPDGLADERISKVSLAPGSNVPDGSSYTLRYEYRGQRFEEIGLRVHLGTLLAE